MSVLTKEQVAKRMEWGYSSSGQFADLLDTITALQAENGGLRGALQVLTGSTLGGMPTYGEYINALQYARAAIAGHEAGQPIRALPCGCIPAIVSPSCPKGHVSGAFVNKLTARPVFHVEAEDEDLPAKGPGGRE